MKNIISCVKSDSNGVIEKCKMENGNLLTKQEIIDKINNDEVVETNNGTKVRVVDNKHIRTDSNSTKEDNLDVNECKK